MWLPDINTLQECVYTNLQPDEHTEALNDIHVKENISLYHNSRGRIHWSEEIPDNCDC